MTPLDINLSEMWKALWNGLPASMTTAIQVICVLAALVGFGLFIFSMVRGRGAGMGGMGGGLGRKLGLGTSILLVVFAIAPLVLGQIVFGIIDVCILGLIGLIKVLAGLIGIHI